MNVSSFSLSVPDSHVDGLRGECGTTLTALDPDGVIMDSSEQEHSAISLNGPIPEDHMIQIVDVSEDGDVFVEPIVDTSEIVEMW